MTLVVEDGTGRPDAESYASVAALREYAAAFGLSLGAAATEDDKAEQVLRQATAYLAGYGPAWQGARTTGAQALDWPRTGATFYGADIPADSVPLQLQRACAALAQKAVFGPLIVAETREKIRTKVGPLETEYTPGARRQTRYPDVENLIAPLLSPVSGNIRLRRS